MPPAPPTRSRPPSRAATQTPVTAPTRMTRTRAATKETVAPASGPSLPSKSSAFLAKGKEGLRKVSDKMKEKERAEKEKADKLEKERAAARRAVMPNLSEGTAHTENLQAFLRIRPPPIEGSFSGIPYLEEQGEKDVLMRAPTDPARPHIAPKAPLIYSFDRVFSPSTTQSTFFTTTTLPLVEKLLQGENGLMFAYGVSNSGKSYTISGGENADVRGVLPRGIDVVFNSIKGMECKTNLRCLGLADVEIGREDAESGLFDHLPTEAEGSTSESVKVDRNYSYAVFVSYSEVYNEKIFDLLDSVLPVSPTVPPTPSGRKASTAMPRGSALPRGSSAWASGLNSSMHLAALANGGGGIIRRQALALKNDPEGNGKYIAGLKEIRVRTREEALAVFRAGQRARQVFGTLANRESSRSHGIFTIKVVKVHNGAPNDPESAQVSRLAIVDLAGSERTRNTGTTGDRLKEAGNINKSLMVLGQCLEVLRANQQKLSAAGAPGTKKKLALVPFRHSKLTEIFQNFFVGDGRAVMIVNVNPYDTGFDENSHVMRFSAIAREVQTTAGNKMTAGGGLRRQISTQFSALKHAVRPMKIKVTVPVMAPPPAPAGPSSTFTPRRPPPEHRDSADSYVMVEEELEVVEEDPEDESDEEDERDVMVDHLFEELREMKQRLFEAEMRNATIEMDVREEVAQEMQATIQKMHDDFAQRLQEQVKAGELKTDRKIDILSRVMTPAVPRISKPLREGQRYLASTPDIDMDTSADISMGSSSIDASFESAIDESLLEGTVSPLSRASTRGRISDVTDPFIAGSALRRQASAESEDESGPEEGDQSMGDTSLEISPRAVRLPTSYQAANKAVQRVRNDAGDTSIDTAATDESADPLADASGALSSEGEVAVAVDADAGVDSDVSDAEEEREDGDATEDEETETEEESDEEEEEEESGSSFAESDAESVSSAEPSPPRRTSTKKPRQTVSPSKRRQPATPSRKQGSPPKRAKAPERLMSPLSESSKQNEAVELSSDEDEEIAKPKPKTKKRTLGKKIVMEDEMDGGDILKTPGADVKRMTPKSAMRK